MAPSLVAVVAVLAVVIAAAVVAVVRITRLPRVAIPLSLIALRIAVVLIPAILVLISPVVLRGNGACRRERHNEATYGDERCKRTQGEAFDHKMSSG